MKKHLTLGQLKHYLYELGWTYEEVQDGKLVMTLHGRRATYRVIILLDESVKVLCIYCNFIQTNELGAEQKQQLHQILNKVNARYYTVKIFENEQQQLTSSIEYDVIDSYIGQATWVNGLSSMIDAMDHIHTQVS
jgi:hypothetical protein